MGKKKKIVIGSVVGVLVIAFVGFGVRAAMNSAPKDNLPKNAKSVEVAETSVETIVSTLSVKGNIDFVNKESIFPSSSAKIKAIHVKDGDIVEKGKVLVTYDEKTLEDLQDRLKDAELALKTSELSLKSVSLPSSETEVLSAESGVSQAKKGIDDINNQIQQADITLEQLERGLQTAKEEYAKAEDNLVKNKVLYDSGLISKNDYENLVKAFDATVEAVKKAEEAILTSTNQKNGLLVALANAKESLNLSEKQQETVVNKTKDPKIQNQKELQQVSVEQAKRSIEKIQKEINDFKLEETASVSGTVVSLGYVEGQTATPAQAICIIADTSNKNLVVNVNIPENQSTAVELNQKAIIKGGALGTEEYEGLITKISPVAEKKQIGNSMETVVTAEITVSDPNAKIKSGYSVDTVITTNTYTDAVVFPLMATSTDEDNKAYVFVLKEDSSVEKRYITILAYSGLNVTASEISLGEKVILSPSADIKDGDFVRVSTLPKKDGEDAKTTETQPNK